LEEVKNGKNFSATSTILKKGNAVRPRQCYVEESSKPRDTFMVETYKILKSLMKNLRRLVLHLGDEEGHR
jgi:hypothetical protein